MGCTERTNEKQKGKHSGELNRIGQVPAAVFHSAATWLQLVEEQTLRAQLGLREVRKSKRCECNER